MDKKAVIVGVTYPSSPKLTLKGAANDASYFARMLYKYYGYKKSEIILLIDKSPDSIKVNLCDPELCLPIRENILKALEWLTSNLNKATTLIFYFSGLGVLLNDMSGWEGEGYEEAILPLDYYKNKGSVNYILLKTIRHYFLALPSFVNVCIFLDCAGGHSFKILNTEFCCSIFNLCYSPLRYEGFWPFLQPNGKVIDKKSKKKQLQIMNEKNIYTKIKTLGVIEVGSLDDLNLHPPKAFAEAFSSSFEGPKWCIFVASEHNQTPSEFYFPPIPDLVDHILKKKIPMGFFTWVMINSLIKSSTIFNNINSKNLNMMLREFTKNVQVMYPDYTQSIVTYKSLKKDSEILPLHFDKLYKIENYNETFLNPHTLLHRNKSQIIIQNCEKNNLNCYRLWKNKVVKQF